MSRSRSASTARGGMRTSHRAAPGLSSKERTGTCEPALPRGGDVSDTVSAVQSPGRRGRPHQWNLRLSCVGGGTERARTGVRVSQDGAPWSPPMSDVRVGPDWAHRSSGHRDHPTRADLQAPGGRRLGSEHVRLRARRSGVHVGGGASGARRAARRANSTSRTRRATALPPARAETRSRCLRSAGGETVDISFAQLRGSTNRFAHALRALGLRRGERLFALTGRVPELYVAALGALKQGCVFSPALLGVRARAGPRAAEPGLGPGAGDYPVALPRQGRARACTSTRRSSPITLGRSGERCRRGHRRRRLGPRAADGLRSSTDRTGGGMPMAWRLHRRMFAAP